jgi:hypothetical protein
MSNYEKLKAYIADIHTETYIAAMEFARDDTIQEKYKTRCDAQLLILEEILEYMTELENQCQTSN